jgi:hypothetical protein
MVQPNFSDHLPLFPGSDILINLKTYSLRIYFLRFRFLKYWIIDITESATLMTTSPIPALISQFRQFAGFFIKEELIMAMPDRIKNPACKRESDRIFFIKGTFFIFTVFILISGTVVPARNAMGKSSRWIA